MNQRRLAFRLIDHAAKVMPPSRSDWAAAMRAELAVTADGGGALRWAAGCVLASYRERIQPMDVFLKSLLRALAVWLVVLSFVVAMSVIHPLRHPQLTDFARILSLFYGGMFVTLWIAELFIARFWSGPGKIFKKSLLRAFSLWLWPLGLCIFQMIRFFNDPVAMRHLDGHFREWLGHWLINWVSNYPVMFVAMFLPLLLCEALLARFWKSRKAAV